MGKYDISDYSLIVEDISLDPGFYIEDLSDGPSRLFVFLSGKDKYCIDVPTKDGTRPSDLVYYWKWVDNTWNSLMDKQEFKDSVRMSKLLDTKLGELL